MPKKSGVRRNALHNFTTLPERPKAQLVPRPKEQLATTPQVLPEQVPQQWAQQARKLGSQVQLVQLVQQARLVCSCSTPGHSGVLHSAVRRTAQQPAQPLARRPALALKAP